MDNHQEPEYTQPGRLYKNLNEMEKCLNENLCFSLQKPPSIIVHEK